MRGLQVDIRAWKDRIQKNTREFENKFKEVHQDFVAKHGASFLESVELRGEFLGRMARISSDGGPTFPLFQIDTLKEEVKAGQVSLKKSTALKEMTEFLISNETQMHELEVSRSPEVRSYFQILKQNRPTYRSDPRGSLMVMTNEESNQESQRIRKQAAKRIQDFRSTYKKGAASAIRPSRLQQINDSNFERFLSTLGTEADRVRVNSKKFDTRYTQLKAEVEKRYGLELEASQHIHGFLRKFDPNQVPSPDGGVFPLRRIRLFREEMLALAREQGLLADPSLAAKIGELVTNEAELLGLEAAQSPSAREYFALDRRRSPSIERVPAAAAFAESPERINVRQLKNLRERAGILEACRNQVEVGMETFRQAGGAVNRIRYAEDLENLANTNSPHFGATVNRFLKFDQELHRTAIKLRNDLEELSKIIEQTQAKYSVEFGKTFYNDPKLLQKFLSEIIENRAYLAVTSDFREIDAHSIPPPGKLRSDRSAALNEAISDIVNRQRKLLQTEVALDPNIHLFLTWGTLKTNPPIEVPSGWTEQLRADPESAPRLLGQLEAELFQARNESLRNLAKQTMHPYELLRAAPSLMPCREEYGLVFRLND